jgi:hypothetical protein
MHHIRQLLNLVSKFPKTNPSPSNGGEKDEDAEPSPSSEDRYDLSRQLAQIRSRYKALCSNLGIKPRPFILSTAATGGTSNADSDEGPDAVGKKKSVWSTIAGQNAAAMSY